VTVNTPIATVRQGTSWRCSVRGKSRSRTENNGDIQDVRDVCHEAIMDIQDRRTTLEPRGALASCGPCADRRYGRLVGMPSTDHNSERFQQVRHMSSSCP
jgi:hypothetical protein